MSVTMKAMINSPAQTTIFTLTREIVLWPRYNLESNIVSSIINLNCN